MFTRIIFCTSLYLRQYSSLCSWWLTGPSAMSQFLETRQNTMVYWGIFVPASTGHHRTSINGFMCTDGGESLHCRYLPHSNQQNTVSNPNPQQDLFTRTYIFTKSHDCCSVLFSWYTKKTMTKKTMITSRRCRFTIIISFLGSLEEWTVYFGKSTTTLSWSMFLPR